jgi:hypothetical protein
MRTEFLNWFGAKLRQRFYAILWGTVASEIETDSLLHEAENLDRIESEARRYEDDGKVHLAEFLRRRASHISSNSPGGSALDAIANLSGDTVPGLDFQTPWGPNPTNEPEPTRLPSPAGTRRRRSRRSSGASQSADE